LKSKKGRKKEMPKGCCSPQQNIMILPCSGRANTGQLSNQAAIELTQEGFGNMFCTAGVGGKISGFVKSAQNVPTIVAIDGCEVSCVKAILQHAEVPLKNHVIITELGIEKNMDFNLQAEDVQKVKAAARAVCEGKTTDGPTSVAASSGSCCG